MPQGFAQKVAKLARTTSQDSARRPRRILYPLAFAIPTAAAAALALFIGIHASHQDADTNEDLATVPAPAPTAERAESRFSLEGFASELNELEAIDSLLAIQDVQSLDDDAIADLLF
ncbi:hypothetical protein BH23VER1_BH23VER1_23260 [soil metagenome]